MSRRKYILAGGVSFLVAIISLIFYINNAVNPSSLNTYYSVPEYCDRVAQRFVHKKKGPMDLMSFELMMAFLRRSPEAFNRFLINNINSFDAKKLKVVLYHIARDLMVDKLLLEEVMKNPNNAKEVKKNAIFYTYLTSFYLNQPLNLSKIQQDQGSTKDELEDKYIVWKFSVNTKAEMDEILSMMKISKKVPVISDLIEIASRYCQPVRYASTQYKVNDVGLSKQELSQRLTADELKAVTDTNHRGVSRVVRSQDGKQTVFYVQKSRGLKSSLSFVPMPDQAIVSSKRDEYIKSQRIKVVYAPQSIEDCMKNPNKTMFSVAELDIIEGIPNVVQAKEIIAMASILFPNQESISPVNVKYLLSILLFVYSCAILAKETRWNETQAFARNLSFNMIEEAVRFTKNRKGEVVRKFTNHIFDAVYLTLDSDNIVKQINSQLNLARNLDLNLFGELITNYSIDRNSKISGNIEKLKSKFGHSVFDISTGDNIFDPKDIKVNKVYAFYNADSDKTSFVYIKSSKEIEDVENENVLESARKRINAMIG